MSTHHDPEWLNEVPQKTPIGLVALLTGLAVTLGGGALFLATTWKAEAPEEPVATVAAPAEDSSADLAEAAPPPPDPMQVATEAQERVTRLQAELDEATARIEAFEADEAKDAERSAAARQRWREMEAEVARLQVALADATAERDALRTELASTLKQLDEQIALTARVEKEREVWKKASTDNLWAAFVQSTKVKLCDRGTRKSMSRCQETVAAAFGADARQRFDHCVAARQSVPALVEVDRRSDPPAFSEPFPEGARQIDKEWHVVYCDPTLPEANIASSANELPEPTVMVVATR